MEKKQSRKTGQTLLGLDIQDKLAYRETGNTGMNTLGKTSNTCGDNNEDRRNRSGCDIYSSLSAFLVPASVCGGM